MHESNRADVCLPTARQEEREKGRWPPISHVHTFEPCPTMAALCSLWAASPSCLNNAAFSAFVSVSQAVLLATFPVQPCGSKESGGGRQATPKHPQKVSFGSTLALRIAYFVNSLLSAALRSL